MRGALLANLLDFHGAPDSAPPVESINEVQERREAGQRQVLRHFSLVLMNRAAGIRRSKSTSCGCGRPISANKTHCARCNAGAETELETIAAA
jgi:hypothetical protein